MPGTGIFDTDHDPANFVDPAGMDSVLMTTLQWLKAAPTWVKIAAAGIAATKVFCKVVAYLDLHYRVGDQWAPRNPPPDWAQIICDIDDLLF